MSSLVPILLKSTYGVIPKRQIKNPEDIKICDPLVHRLTISNVKQTTIATATPNSTIAIIVVKEKLWYEFVDSQNKLLPTTYKTGSAVKTAKRLLNSNFLSVLNCHKK
jgi:hypothetical protein